MSGAAVLLALSVVALPPPLCRGKTAARFDPKQNRTPEKRAVAEIQLAYASLCPLVASDGICGTGDIWQNETIGNNAITWVSGLGEGKNTRAMIIYSAAFLNSLSKSFGDGASFGVLAHEVGHHLTAAGNLRKKFDHSWDEELRADYFAGCALARARRRPDEMENALRALASNASPSHPSFARRTVKVRKGYNDCAKIEAKEEVKTGASGFGLGAVIRKKTGKFGCWRYRYREKEEMRQLGPVAAPRRPSRDFASAAACNADRTAHAEREADDCICAGLAP